MVPVYSIRTASSESIAVLAAHILRLLGPWAPWSPRASSTRGTSIRNTWILKSINSIQTENTTSNRRIYSRNTASTRSAPVAFCKQMGMKLSNRRTNGRIILLTPSIHTAYIQSTPSTRSTHWRNAASTCSTRNTDRTLNCLEVQGVCTDRTPKYGASGSIRSTEPRNTASTRSIPQ